MITVFSICIWNIAISHCFTILKQTGQNSNNAYFCIHHVKSVEPKIYLKLKSYYDLNHMHSNLNTKNS